MNNPLLKRSLPHIIAVILFLAVSALFCKPILDGQVMNQHDNVGWKGMAQNAIAYKEAHGHYPLWNPNLFSGMPNYQVTMQGKSVMPDMVKIFSLGMPKPINFFFLACVCFYILCLALKVRPIIAMLSGLAYAFATYNPVIIAAGHDTQMLATAFMPLVLAGIILTYEKKYWLGFALTTYGAYQQIGFNHLQVSYYFFLIAALVTIPYVIKWIKEKDWKHLGIAASITAVAGIIALAGNAMTLKTTSEYSKYTMRGGKDIEITDTTVKAVKTKGLDTSYAFEYSLGKAETFTLMMPGAFGGGSSAHYQEGSKFAEKLNEKGFNGEQIAQSPGVKYWGKIYTAGPQYLGVFIFLLGILGFVIIKTPLRWGLLAATVLGIFMTWGKYFVDFNVFLFENLPYYNKFRAPSFAQVIPQLTLGVMAALTLQQLLFAEKSKEFLKKNFKKIMYTIGGVFVFVGLIYLGMGYSMEGEQEYMKSEQGRQLLSLLKAERKAMFGGQLLRALGLALLGAGVLYAYVKDWIKPLAAAIILLVISTAEITLTSYKYFNNDNDQYRDRREDEKLFVSKDDYKVNFNASAIDNQILEDKSPHFRVFNMSVNTFSDSRTSYYHRSVGGYHPAKLRIYQDVIEKYLSPQRPNISVLRMLDTKYVIIPTGQNQPPALDSLPDSYGAAWLVKNVKLVNDRVEAIQALGKENLKDTAIVENSFAKNVVQPQWDSTARIDLVKFDNDTVEYKVTGKGPQFAVFSEIYYPKGWNAYLSDKKAGYVKVDYVNANYILRGLSVPAGEHTIKFVFEPASVKKGRSIMFMASILILIIFLGGIFMHFRELQSLRKKQPNPAYPDVPA